MDRVLVVVEGSYVIVDVWKKRGLQIQFMCWMGPLLLDTGTANDVLFDGLFQKNKKNILMAVKHSLVWQQADRICSQF